jgi:predicted aconitase
VLGAHRLIPIVGAHVDSCLYHGQASLDFVDRLAAGGARVTVPTTLNVGLVDLIHPELWHGDAATADRGRLLMERYRALGCRPTYTCAPYQLDDARPGLGEQVAWAESNAIAFANSVLGARTNRYGDFIDVACAIAGRVPDAGLHRTDARRARLVLRLADDVPASLRDADVLYPVLGLLVGREAGSEVPVLVGLPPEVGEDRLKALGAAAASSGSVGMFHVVGVTPEASTLQAALGGGRARREVQVTTERLRPARDELTTAPGDRIGAVSLGTPHASAAELDRIAGLLDGGSVHPDVETYVSTGRDVLDAAPEAAASLEGAGVRVVTDTCTYVTPILRGSGPVMTDSAKWAYYAPGNLGVDVVFGSTEECVRSATAGRVWRDPGLWAGI